MNKRKIICLLICAMLIILIIGCGKSSDTNERSLNNANSVESVLAQGMSDPPAAEEVIPVPEAAETELPTSGSDEEESKGEAGIDVDLTILSSTMVYSEVYDMMVCPENYVGKIVKMSGVYTMFHDENTDKYYHACVITDATACCAQGIEFELSDDFVFPDDYPEEGDPICIVGTFETYMEGENTYCTLRQARYG